MNEAKGTAYYILSLSLVPFRLDHDCYSTIYPRHCQGQHLRPPRDRLLQAGNVSSLLQALEESIGDRDQP